MCLALVRSSLGTLVYLEHILIALSAARETIRTIHTWRGSWAAAAVQLRQSETRWFGNRNCVGTNAHGEQKFSHARRYSDVSQLWELEMQTNRITSTRRIRSFNQFVPTTLFVRVCVQKLYAASLCQLTPTESSVCTIDFMLQFIFSWRWFKNPHCFTKSLGLSAHPFPHSYTHLHNKCSVVTKRIGIRRDHKAGIIIRNLFDFLDKQVSRTTSARPLRRCAPNGVIFCQCP